MSNHKLSYSHLATLHPVVHKRQQIIDFWRRTVGLLLSHNSFQKHLAYLWPGFLLFVSENFTISVSFLLSISPKCQLSFLSSISLLNTDWDHHAPLVLKDSHPYVLFSLDHSKVYFVVYQKNTKQTRLVKKKKWTHNMLLRGTDFG